MRGKERQKNIVKICKNIERQKNRGEKRDF